ncbi:MAG: hypothetical protein R3A44_19980 [Caldilineaceae bacterium]
MGFMRVGRRLKRFGIIVGILIGALLLIALIPLVGVAVQCRPFAEAPISDAEQHMSTVGEVEARPEDQTYLTFPEWYIVYSADEYAAFVADNRPSRFPFFAAMRQYWRAYYNVCAVTRERYAFNGGYHLTLVVIGVSFTYEDLFKGLYEKSIGRATEWISSPELTPEDAYARQVAQEYGDFIHTIPWYEFPFDEKLRGLWREMPLWGPNAIRKWERKLALSAEYGGKALYGRLIRQGTAAAYGAEELEIQAVVSGVSDALLQAEPEVKLMRQLGNGHALISVPRYEAFTQLVPRLAAQGVQFIEIAGNDQILVTLIAPSDWRYDLPTGRPLFAMPVLIAPQNDRMAVEAPVSTLHLLLNALKESPARLEHIYDY